jgi:hypothetical protein
LEGSVKNDGDFGNKILKNTLKENLWFNCQNQIKKKKKAKFNAMQEMTIWAGGS